jgi:5-methylcytosine-specific restriction endonuclease McrA
MRRGEVFARDGGRCVYCGEVFEVDQLTVDHVEPRVRRGDRSSGNLVTACRACNTRKGSQSLATFLSRDTAARENFFRYATAVWPRHLHALEQQLRSNPQIISDR